MRIRTLRLLLWITIAFLGTRVAEAQQRLVIDDFKTGEYLKTLSNDQEIAYRTGTGIAGGVRQTFLFVGPGNQYNQPTTLHIRNNGPMIIDSGLKSFFGLFLSYGYTINGEPNPLNLDLSAYDRFRIRFDSSDLEMGYGILIYDRNGNQSNLDGTDSTASRLSEFNADLHFADFSPGYPNPIDWDHIDFIGVLFQSGSAIAGNDFAVKSILAIKPQPNQ